MAMVNDGHTLDFKSPTISPVEEDENDDEDFGKFESKGESLLSLVQPELSSLAEHWLAALRDHALLQLPPGMCACALIKRLSERRSLSHTLFNRIITYICAEYSSQLPRDGGSFYTNDTMDSCRPHYCSTWPSLLHAATLWLTSDFFKAEPNEKNDKAAKKATEYFGLIFGELAEGFREFVPMPVRYLSSGCPCLCVFFSGFQVYAWNHCVILV